MKHLLVGLVLLLASCAAVPPTPATISAAMDSVVALEVRRNGQDFPYCSGVVIAPGKVLTNRHCVEVPVDFEIMVRFRRGGELQKAVLVGKTSVPYDAAILAVDTGMTPAASVRHEPVRVGETVFAVGMPKGLRWSVTKGIVSAVDRYLALGEEEKVEISEGPWIQTDASINPGNSGGALFDEYGRLVGITTLKMTGMDNLGFARSIAEVMKWVQEWIA